MSVFESPLIVALAPIVVAGGLQYFAERQNKRVAGKDAELIRELRKELEQRDRIIRDMGRDL